VARSGDDKGCFWYDLKVQPLFQLSRQMKYKIKSFILGVKEARRILCTAVHGRPARRAYNMGRKLSNGFRGLPARISADW